MLDTFYAVNAKAPLFLIRKELDLMPEGGRVINISSVCAHVALPVPIAYAMSKGALEQITRYLAPDLALRNITINTVVPGATNNGGPVFADPEVVKRMFALSAVQPRR